MDDSARDRRPDRSSVADERGNPFVTFSRLVDQQVSNFFRNFTDLPSTFARSRPDGLDTAEQQRRWNGAKEEAEQLERSFNELFASHPEERHEKNDGSSDDHSVLGLIRPPAYRGYAPRDQEEPFDKVSENLASWNLQDRIRDEEEDLRSEYEEAERVMDCIRSRIAQLYPLHDYRDREPRCPYRPADEDLEEKNHTRSLGYSLPSLDRAFAKPSSAQYGDESPYPEVNPENQDPFREHRARWRRAFANLLSVSHGKGLSEDVSAQEPTAESDWIDSLARHALIGHDPLRVKKVSTEQPDECATGEPGNDASEDPTTELELYDRFLGSQPPRATSSASTQTVFSSNTSGPADPEKPSLISTLTTTERRTLPDGSVYTQVVLKKRFSDGREESTETEHTTHGTQRPYTRKPIVESAKQTPSSTPSLGHDGKIKQALGQKIEEQKKKGWFWS
ncbi:MAG: hypothetical protein L6R39_003094 [Caloplaca ligustica]|nr:MAG: hypothetical protein L6R39_003094 [Caloplaca ligustica]